MKQPIKKESQILTKLGIDALNDMQQEANLAIASGKDVVLLSPTGTGKTLAFLLPLIKSLDPKVSEIQCLIVVPSRELAIQIEQVIREMGSGYKANAVYGGRSGTKDKIDIKHRPAILIGTPGRLADHLRRNNFSPDFIKHLVLDEFDKSLEVGFEEEMNQIIQLLPDTAQKVLTSATQGVQIPPFVHLSEPLQLDFLVQHESKLELKKVVSPKKDKLETLVELLKHVGNEPGIIFCNFKDSIDRISDFLDKNNVSHGCFYGGMEQKDRERALIKFRNGSHQLLLATDLAARGIDVPEIAFIMHYHLPHHAEEFTHRNGRTARMNKHGVGYIITSEFENLPAFIPEMDEINHFQPQELKPSFWTTIFVSGGRKDKISKGDIVGMLTKQADLTNDNIGAIELKQDCAFVAVPKHKVKQIETAVNNQRLKKKKVRIFEI